MLIITRESIVLCLTAPIFRFANTLGNNMVLQQQPYKSQVWGFCDTTSTIQLKLINETDNNVIQQKNTTTDTDNIWLVQLNPMHASNTAYKITVTCSTQNNQTIELNNILFGDVYVCSGQSNMQFTVDCGFNATQYTEEANNYPYIRVFTTQNNLESSTVQTELPKIYEPWSVANNKSIGCGNWTCFSAVCWFTGLNLYKRLKYPIGLISSTRSGSPVRCWMPYETAAECNENITRNNYSPSICWNAMIAPFLRTTIVAVLWYQGEQDTKQEPFDYEYACSFPLMISTWRAYWSQYSDTNKSFPFGYVQLSVFLDSTENVTCGNNESVSCMGGARVRWGQSANKTSLPNDKMLNTFFATAIDLGDPYTPWVAPLGPVHPRYKKPIGDRLADGAMNIVYGNSASYFGGPYASKAIFNNTKNSKGYDIVTVIFTNVGEEGILIKHFIGFELYDMDVGWFNAFDKIENNGDFGIDLIVPSNVSYTVPLKKIRYNFYTAPCLPYDGIYQCAIYDKQYQLPAIPFIMNLSLS